MAQRILYVLVPDEQVSPFDVTLAVDAGYEMVLPFTGVKPNDVVTAVQAAIFARPPKRFHETGIFIGGRDVHLATDMLLNAKNAMVGPFQVGVFADPNGAYTTAASVVSLVEKALVTNTGKGLQDRSVAIFGPGPVGLSTAVLAAKQGAKVKLCQLISDDDPRFAHRFAERYEVEIGWEIAETYNGKIKVLEEPEVVICTAKAGIRILGKEEMAYAKNLIIAADTNAVPPSGIEEIDAKDNNKFIETDGRHFWGIGPMQIGNMKYKVQFGLFEKMQESEKAAVIDFPEAYEFALEILGK